MEIPGFILLLQDFCEYCPEFEPEIEKNTYSYLGDSCKCYTNIRCKNRKKCAKIAESIRKSGG